ncbi:MAG: hypothetical protein L0J03_10140 [Brevibacterium sp.]|nr:hypothetical protein [Brevibacterium sp.]
MNTWHTTTTVPTTLSEDDAFDLLGTLTDRGAAIEFGTHTMTVSMTGYGDNALAAAEDAATTLREAIPGTEILGVDAQTYEQLDEELRRPLFPEVVGYAEIAEKAGVRRQGARGFVDYEEFPHPVIETKQGPLRSKAAVERFLSRKQRTRIKKTAAH